jgi:hypothetical protein
MHKNGAGASWYGSVEQPLVALHSAIQGMLYTCLSVQRVVELVDWRWNLKTLLEDLLLSLNSDVPGPLHETAKIPSGLDVLSDPKVPGSLLKQRVVLLPLRVFLSLGRQRWRGRNLLPRNLLLSLNMPK